MTRPKHELADRDARDPVLNRPLPDALTEISVAAREAVVTMAAIRVDLEKANAMMEIVGGGMMKTLDSFTEVQAEVLTILKDLRSLWAKSPPTNFRPRMPHENPIEED